MDSTVVSSKGQVIIPKAVRDAQQWPPGTVLRVVAQDGGVLLTAEPLFTSTEPAQAAGCLRQAARAMRSVDTDAALRRRAKKEDLATRR